MPIIPKSIEIPEDDLNQIRSRFAKIHHRSGFRKSGPRNYKALI